MTDIDPPAAGPQPAPAPAPEPASAPTPAPDRPDLGFAVFDTALGRCAIAWTAAGLIETQLPHADPEHNRRRFAARYGAHAEKDPPAAVRAVIDGIVALLAGAPVNFDDVPLDPTGVPEFNQRVYQLARTIPPGKTLSYGEIASRLGAPGAARAVGRALGDNPYPIVVPCHRVVAADGSMHGFSAPGGIATKRRMLQIEGALPPEEPTLF